MKIITVILIVYLCLFIPVNAQWSNGQAAQYVVGQADFGTATSGHTSQKMTQPQNIAIDYANGKMYVSDSYNNRVLRFAYPLVSDNPVAELVFGQSDMTTITPNTGGIGASTLRQPFGVAVYDGALWVADSYNRRLLKYSNAYSLSSNKPSANVVLGQVDFATVFLGCDQVTTGWVLGIAFDASGNLWVAENTNHSRVLKFANANTLTNGAAASLVLGVGNFTNLGTGSTSATTFVPSGICVSGTTVWVVDNSSSRVLRFDNPVANGAAANAVLGQADFTSYSSGATASTMTSPSDCRIDNDGRLYVSDGGNHRILVFNNAASKANGAAADYVLGQPDFTTYASSCTQSTFYGPAGIEIGSDNKVLVADVYNNRVLQFASSSPLPVELVSFTAVTTAKKVEIRWRTATEVNNAGFAIEKAIGKSNTWEHVGFVEGHGTTNAPQSYTFTDKAGAGSFQYRLKQIDRDGKFEYSKEVEVAVVALPASFALSQNYPNPFNPSTVIGYSIASTSHVALRVYDMLGREVAVLVNRQMEPGNYTATFDASRIASGVYFYKLEAGNFSDVKRLNIMK